MSAQQRREAVGFLEARGLSERRGCALSGIGRSSRRYRAVGRDDSALAAQLKRIAQKYRRYGYRRAHQHLRREGLVVNPKRVRRVWMACGLQLPKRKRRRRGQKGAVPLRAERPNHVWTYDFMQDATSDGRKLRFLNVEDEYTRQNLAIEVGRHMPARAVLGVLERLLSERGTPEFIRSDNGPEFIAKEVKQWLSRQGVKTHYIDPASPWQNAFCESFNGKFRDECLNMEVFHTVLEARVLATQWRHYYNTERPHSSLGYRTPDEFAHQCRVQEEGESCREESGVVP